MSSSAFRPLRDEDADAVAALFVEAWGDARRMDGDEIRSWLRNEALGAENLQVLVEDGRVTGYVDLWLEEGVMDVDAAAPGRWHEVLDRAEQEARDRGAERVHTFFADGHKLEVLVAARGYRNVRPSYTMEIRFGVESPPERPVPDGIEIRPYRHPDDEQATYEAQEEAFADHWGSHPRTLETWRAFSVEQASFDPTLWLLAWDGDEVAGLSLNFSERSGDPGYGWVGTVGVRPAWRRRGIAEALLHRSFAALHARGYRTIRLSVDAENATGATRLYERAGMSVLRQSNTWELLL
jgi:mycothiol synthase